MISWMPNVSFSRSIMNILSPHVQPVSQTIAPPSAWFYWRFLSVQREFFLSSVAKCLMIAGFHCFIAGYCYCDLAMYKSSRTECILSGGLLCLKADRLRLRWRRKIRVFVHLKAWPGQRLREELKTTFYSINCLVAKRAAPFSCVSSSIEERLTLFYLFGAQRSSVCPQNDIQLFSAAARAAEDASWTLGGNSVSPEAHRRLAPRYCRRVSASPRSQTIPVIIQPPAVRAHASFAEGVWRVRGQSWKRELKRVLEPTCIQLPKWHMLYICVLAVPRSLLAVLCARW